ncbi:MAG: cupin domain-containing protein [Candidatus Thorarchaeota archaeon]
MKIIRDLGIGVDIVILYNTKLLTKAMGHRRKFIFDYFIVLMVRMVRIFKASGIDPIEKKGYSAKYVADIVFRKDLNSAGFILVTIPAGERTEPHMHEELEEVFVVLSDLRMTIDSEEYDLENGDVIVVSPNELHSFSASTDSSASLLAIKFPNLKDDRTS